VHFIFKRRFLLNSCEDSNDTILEEAVNWQQNTIIKFAAEEDKETFIWYYDLLTNEDYWGNDEVELDI